MSDIRNSFREIQEVQQRFATEENINLIETAILQMAQALKNGNTLISCGNGGSMSDAMHFAEELSGRFRNDRPPLAALSISDPTHITCTGNDYGFDFIFSRFVEGIGKTGDVLLAISTSGNSANVLNAARVAKEKGMTVVALTGKSGGQLAGLADIEIRVPHTGYADRIQEVHIQVIHLLIEGIEKNLFPNS